MFARPLHRLPIVAAVALVPALSAFADPLPDPTAPPDAIPSPSQAQPGVPPAEPSVSPAEATAKPDDGDADRQSQSRTSAEKQKLPENLEPVAPSEATAILGKKVRGPDGKEVVGAIVDILIDDQGQSRAAIVDCGGFLGVGSRKIAVDWRLLSFRPTETNAPIVLNLDPKQIQAAPEYKDPTQPAAVVEAPAPASAPENAEDHPK